MEPLSSRAGEKVTGNCWEGDFAGLAACKTERSPLVALWGKQNEVHLPAQAQEAARLPVPKTYFQAAGYLHENARKVLRIERSDGSCVLEITRRAD